MASYISSIPYKWLFPRCAAAIHHGGRLGLIFFNYFSIILRERTLCFSANMLCITWPCCNCSGATAAALHAGIPQVPFPDFKSLFFFFNLHFNLYLSRIIYHSMDIRSRIAYGASRLPCDKTAYARNVQALL